MCGLPPGAGRRGWTHARGIYEAARMRSDPQQCDTTLLHLADQTDVTHLQGAAALAASLGLFFTGPAFAQGVVKAKHVFSKGELKDRDIDTILADLAKILPGKK